MRPNVRIALLGHVLYSIQPEKIMNAYWKECAAMGAFLRLLVRAARQRELTQEECEAHAKDASYGVHPCEGRGLLKAEVRHQVLVACHN
eukprot:scaffold381346_cov42-Prasinocladus_malaysianus.AAC.1